LLTIISFWKSAAYSTKPRVWQISTLQQQGNHNLLFRCCLSRSFFSRKGFLGLVLSHLGCFCSPRGFFLLCLSRSRFLASFSHNVSPRCPSGT